METLKIVKNQPFVLWIPTIMLNANGEQAVEADSLKDVVINAGSGCESYEIEHHAYKHWLVLEFGDNLKVGPYKITITGSLSSGRKFNLALAKPIEIVNWDYESNWDRFIVGDHIELTDHPFITGEFLTDAELEQLKEQLRQEIAATQDEKEAYEAAKEAFEQKAAELEGIAKETTSQEILGKVENIGVIAEELEAGKTAIVNAIEAQGGEASIEQSLGELAQDIRQLSVFSEGAEFTEEAQRPIDFLYTVAQGRNDIKKLSSNRVTSIGQQAFQYCSNLQSVEMPNVTSIGQQAFQYCSNLQSVEMPNVTSIGVKVFQNCSNLQSVEMPNVTSIGQQAFQYCSNLQSVEMNLLFNIDYESFRECRNLRRLYVPMLVSLASRSLLEDIKLIDFICGSNFNANTDIAVWNPTEALRTDLNSLLTPEDIAAGFTNNRQKLLYNIREHIAANLQEITAGYSITFSAAVKAAILADQETADAFTNKGWTIA